MKLITHEWLNKAHDDIKVIEAIIHDAHLTNMVAFHAQQATEKILKAIIEEFEVGFIRTHSLEVLHEKIKGIITFTIDTELIKRLDGAYIDSRYPGDLGIMPDGKPLLEDARMFHDFARELFEKTNKLLETIVEDD